VFAIDLIFWAGNTVWMSTRRVYDPRDETSGKIDRKGQEKNVKRDENEQRAAKLLRDVTFTGSPVRQLTRAPQSRLLKAWWCWRRQRRHRRRRSSGTAVRLSLRNGPAPWVAAKIWLEKLDAFRRDDRLTRRHGEIGEARDARGARPVCLVARPCHVGRCRVDRGWEKARPTAAVHGCHDQRRRERVCLAVSGGGLQGLLAGALMDIAYQGKTVCRDRRSWGGDGFDRSHAQ